jgi:3-oxoacyl-[acyl-carrier protein] reductase
MNTELKGKRSLVTGSGAGIGAGIARALAAEGARVAVHGRNAGPCEKVAEEIRAAGGDAIVVTGDVTNDAGGQQVADQINAQMGGLDILVNNVGGPGGALTWDNTSMDQWAEQYQLNTLSGVRMIRHFLGGMKDQGFGRVIQIASLAGWRPFPDQVPAYVASKAAMMAVTTSLAQTVAGTGVTANTITPGFVATEALQDYMLGLPHNAGKQWDDIAGEVAQALKCQVGRLGDPKDIASMVVYLAQPSSSWITGSNMRIDGGTCDWTA